MNKNVLKIMLVTGAAGTLLGVGAPASASGFALIEQSVSGLGNAFAGGAAAGEDASTVYFNPAAMTRLQDAQAVGALHYIKPSTQFEDSGRSVDRNAAALTGGDGGDGGVPAMVPNVYYTQPLNNDVTFGLGINAPFGLATEYDADWQGRYHGIESAITTININPSLAFKANEKLSIGAGINLQYIDAKLTNAFDNPAVCAGLEAKGLLPAGTCTTAPQSNDGLAEITGSSVNWSVNYGMLYEFSDATRLGVAYRSSIRHRLSGEVDYTNIASYLAPTNLFVDSDATADIVLPATVAASVYHAFSPKLALMADATWTQWSVLDKLRVEVDTGKDVVEDYGWHNTMRYSVGSNFTASDKLVLRAGLAYDEAPVDNENKLGVRIPDNDRTWLSLGAGFKVARGVQVDVGYTHLFISNPEISRTDSAGHTIDGEFESAVDIVSAQASWNF